MNGIIKWTAVCLLFVCSQILRDLMERRPCLRAVCRIPASLLFREGIKVVPYNHNGLSIEINSSVTSAIISRMVPLIFGHSKLFLWLNLIPRLWHDYGKLVVLLNMQTLIESCFFVNDSSAARCVAVVSSPVTVENSWEVGLLYPTW